MSRKKRMFVGNTIYTFPNTQGAKKHSAFPVITFVKGVLLASWRQSGGHTIFNGEVKISKSTDLGRTWSEPTTIIETPLNGSVGPVGLMPYGDSVMLSFVKQNENLPSEHEAYVTWSHDQGDTWETPVLIEAMAYPAGPACMTADGKILQPLYAYSGVRLWESCDLGATWSYKSHITTDDDFKEVCLKKAENGTLYAFIRFLSTRVYKSVSTDNGATWTTPQDRFDVNGYPAILITNSGKCVMAYRPNPDFARLELRITSDYFTSSGYPPVLVETAAYRSVYADMVEISPNVIALISAIEGNPTTTGKVRFRYITDGPYITPHGENLTS